jgi:hypothetical protein
MCTHTRTHTDSLSLSLTHNVCSKELKSMEVYDPKLGTWRYETSLPSRRWAHCMIAV